MGVRQDLERYRKMMFLEGRVPVELRTLRSDDKLRLLRFFQRVPEYERFYFKENVTAPEVIRDWTTSIDLTRVIPIVAVLDDEIIGDVTLHRSRSAARGWVGEIRLVVDPRYRRKRLALGMLRAIVELARDLGLQKVYIETVEHPERPVHQVALLTGFVPIARLEGWARDRWGNTQDLLVLELPLTDHALWERVVKTLPKLTDVDPEVPEALPATA